MNYYIQKLIKNLMKTQFNISRQRKKYKLMRNDREIKEKKSY